MKAAANVVRLLLTVAVLWVVWHHSHWSVALTLTGLSLSNEIHAFLLSQKKDKEFVYRPKFHSPDFEKEEIR